jgi:hypothetical protein
VTSKIGQASSQKIEIIRAQVQWRIINVSLESFLAIAKRRKLKWFGGHVACSKGSLANIILPGTVEGTWKRG